MLTKAVWPMLDLNEDGLLSRAEFQNLIEDSRAVDVAQGGRSAGEVHVDIARWREALERDFAKPASPRDELQVFGSSEETFFEKRKKEVHLKEQRTFTQGFLEAARDEQLYEALLMFWVVLAQTVASAAQARQSLCKMNVFAKNAFSGRKGAEKGRARGLEGRDSRGRQSHRLLFDSLRRKIQAEMLPGARGKGRLGGEPERKAAPETREKARGAQKGELKCDLVRKFFMCNRGSRPQPNTKEIKSFPTFFKKTKVVSKKPLAKMPKRGKENAFRAERGTGAPLQIDILKRFIRS